MKILFIHQNFPGQFKNLAPALAKKGHQVTALTLQRTNLDKWQGVTLIKYSTHRVSTPKIHPWLVDFETKIIRAEACYQAAMSLRKNGYTPDIIIAHPGWGESLFLKEVWPKAKLGIYFEYYYQAIGADVGFDPEFSNPNPEDACRLKIKNINIDMHLEQADAGICPTQWQASTFPKRFQSKMHVIHDGIDTNLVKPNSNAAFNFTFEDGSSISLTKSNQVITFVNRNLEPLRGYHIFMRALPSILKKYPNAIVLIVGGTEVSYGLKPNPEKYGVSSWKEIFLNEISSDLSKDELFRIKFLNQLIYSDYLKVLQVSTVHVYLTYPFVLGWSFLEAMSAGCSIIASNTEPVNEVLQDQHNGIKVDFFNVDNLVIKIGQLLDNSKIRNNIGVQARNTILNKYDLNSICLSQQIEWAEQLVT